MTAVVSAPACVPFMQPVLRRGRSYLDRELLPGDENEKRLTDLLVAAGERDLDGVVIFGAAHTPENLGYYANYTPTTFHGALVARPGQPPVLFAGKGGARDHPYIRTVSWVADIRYTANIGAGIVEIADGWATNWRVGIAGLDTALPHEVRDEVAEALGDRYLVIDDLVAEQRRAKSAREIAVLGRAHDVAGLAARAATISYAEGAGRRTALAAADYAARAGGAHDCRITAAMSADCGGLVAMSEVRDDRGPLAALVAVEYLGYWGMAAVHLDAGTDADGELDRVVARLRPGVEPADVFGDQRADAGTFLVNGIGCGLVESPNWGDGGSPRLRAQDVVTVVHVDADGPAGLGLDVRTVVLGDTVSAQPL